MLLGTTDQTELVDNVLDIKKIGLKRRGIISLMLSPNMSSLSIVICYILRYSPHISEPAGTKVTSTPQILNTEILLALVKI